MTCNILVLFANDSEKLAMELINQFDNVPINYICVNNHSLQFSNMQEKTQAKIHVVFFSPDFLRFLENNVSDAYLLFGHLESKSSLAVFCLGLKVENVLCYHMAPLKSFLSWSKYEVLSASNENHVFPKELMNRIREVLRQVNFAAKDIVVVPQFLKRHNNTIYVIFPSSIEGCRDLCIRLNEHEDVDISLKKMNPYVMKFSVPDSLFEFSHNVIVRIQCGDRVITDQAVHLSQDTPKNAQVNGTESSKNVHPKFLTRQELMLDEQIRYLKSISGLNSKDDTFSLNPESRRLKTQESQANISESARFDLKRLCKQYGLERLSFLMSHESSLSIDKDEEFTMQEDDIRKQIDEGKKILRYSRLVNDLPEIDSLKQMNSFLGLEAGRHRLFSACRSLSLPSTLLPTSDVRNSYGAYLAMGGKEPTEMKPHERLLMDLQSCKNLERGESKEVENLHEDLMNSISSENYMTLRMSRDQEIDTRTLLKRGLSSSQQELLDLMQDFKEGECTMSYVEDQFQLWKERHCRNSREEEKRTRKTSALAMLWKKPKKKDLKVVIENKDTVKTNTDVKQEEKPSVRKTSNTSASSASSKTSDRSLLTASSKGESGSSEQKSDDGTAPTGWVSSYSPTANRVFIPRYPRTEPPPLPSRPPPWSKISTINKPVPLPRKTLQNSANDTTDVIEEEKTPDLVEDSDDYYEEDEERNASMYELCQKYGLEKLGVCFVSGEYSAKEDGEALERDEMTDININKMLPERPLDSDGYEIPIKKKLGSFRSTSNSGSMRRSISLPSNLSQSYELMDDLLNSTEAEMPHHTENRQNACICGQCNENIDCFRNNFYMSLLEFRRDNSADETSTLLSKSQQELLDLMYAFKRGEKTISQVEYQFKDWHSRHMGKCPRSFVQPYNKLPKQSSFGLPGIMKILGKQKKKSVAENKFEYDPEKGGMKNSESATTAQRLSKLSYTSTSSANSELSESSKVTIESVKSQEATAGLTPPICPKRPPPVPPKKPLYSQELPKSSQILQAQTSPTSIINTGQPKPAKKEKPIPPPKPRFILNLNSTGSSHFSVEQHKKTEEPRQDEEDDSNARPSSPDYIVPDMHRRPGRPKLQRQSREIDCDQKFSTTPVNRQPFSPGLTNTLASRSRKITEPSEAELPTQTLELLKKANLFNPDITKPMFYVRRSNSDPSLKLSQRIEGRKKSSPVQKPHIYLEILP
ncbi:hypothetical protein AVEN_50131-1 [Araneus ventricosus]|uniref:DBB domain-containing protein n=1 Tax=Araneus ventricosus TaxID=182803 RepID=A0A4Y2DAS6_ARAVE|nr:hypothetical protein AVEN_50131-1 [Araneus ventricosus]